MIYIVDDKADNRFLLEQTLKRNCHYKDPIQSLPDGYYLLQHMATVTELPQLILLDLHMPLLNGYQTLKGLKQHLDWQTIPVVIMSADASEQEVEACYGAGADMVLIRCLDWRAYSASLRAICQRWL
ncbi:response regulator [Spirosoma oryzicola]|uniref:response regulator n=1 Tax=Spirosoma oryzicola TaxID=2898794 RepID=UPI001E5E6C07|nr:response regulator [Spirosoma oryzicola]UHG93197.1 response regulator [Spirosoma oryzicola]